jgi:hypothetical protein
MRRVLRGAFRLFAWSLILAATFGAFWFGLVPQRFSPFAPISLEATDQWFLDPRLAALRRDPQLCQSVLKAPHIDAMPVPDQAYKDGCGWINAVKFQTAGGTQLGAEPVTCELAAAVTLWIEHEVQPAAITAFGKKVTGIEDMGTYDCRNIIGSNVWKNVKSQHASANAIDIAGFTLEDGRKVSVLKDWPSKGKERASEALFLRAIKARSCRYFRVSLGPDFNDAHKNHFHFDRGPMWTCR